ncbi:hypothetical protein C8Q78DRAFT_847051 [Trametes maxima]|nr:hypothetical protein C8Q78DRAFT_847051 [Trametes maxima]
MADGSAWRLSHSRPRPSAASFVRFISPARPRTRAMSSSSSASSSSLSPSPASSLSSAPSLAAWSPSHMNTVNTASSRPPAQGAPTIASLPSLAHSLSAFPTMTAVTNDMVHYGTLGRTKGVSEAKLYSALRKTKQRQDAGPNTMVSARGCCRSIVASGTDRLYRCARRPHPRVRGIPRPRTTTRSS